MKVITAVEPFDSNDSDVCVFLAGGITNCPDWQKDVIAEAEKYDKEHPGALNHLVLFNPRRPNFPIGDPNASEAQIKWEFYWLERMNVFSMYFTDGQSDQPICMYELGRNLALMMERYPCDYDKRIVVSANPKYRRFSDVKIQIGLAWGKASIHGGTTIPDIKPFDLIEENNPKRHFEEIVKCYTYVLAHDEYQRDSDFRMNNKLGDSLLGKRVESLEEFLSQGNN